MKNPYIGYEKSSLLAQEVLAGNQSVTEIVEQKGLLSKEEIKLSFPLKP